jgi:predicted nuclease of restriction endonuclease-like (RecB) superfamily
MDFSGLIESIHTAHRELQTRALQAVNVGLTLRNALIGFYIAEYQLHGKDRAEYGERVFESIAAELKGRQVSNTARRQLYRYVEFYRAYPTIVGTLSAQFPGIAKSIALPAKVGTPSPQSIGPTLLVTHLSYSHFEELLDCKDDLQRLFYEKESIQGNWSVRELKRQMGSLYFERSALSKDRTALLALAQKGAETQSPIHLIRDPYLFEFAGLKSKDVYDEKDLENALIHRLQDFLLELGHGFCFEARQKKILIGREHFFVDLVFYHRILKCHVLIELKNDQFRHEHLGQLNSYVSYYEKKEMSSGDNPPIGILLCTRKNEELVEYALAGMSNQLFVSRYQVELPPKEKLQQFLHQFMIEMDTQREPSSEA